MVYDNINFKNIKQNNTAREGDVLFLTKPLGVGILTTAEKKGLLQQTHIGLASKQMMQLNNVGELLGKMDGVHAMTDVTGFGLLGHLVEMAEGSGLSALIVFDNVPLIIEELKNYVDQKCVPGGTYRNWDSYGDKIGNINEYQKIILADPQTSGGLLIAVDENSVGEVKQILSEQGIECVKPIGRFIKKQEKIIAVN